MEKGEPASIRFLRTQGYGGEVYELVQPPSVEAPKSPNFIAKALASPLLRKLQKENKSHINLF